MEVPSGVNVLGWECLLAYSMMRVSYGVGASLWQWHTSNSALKADPYIRIFFGTQPRSTHLHVLTKRAKGQKG